MSENKDVKIVEPIKEIIKETKIVEVPVTNTKEIIKEVQVVEEKLVPSELISFKRSEEISELAIALAKFHEEMESVEKSETNPFFNSKYADLSAILEIVRPKLAKQGLSVLQFPIEAFGNKVSIKTILQHSSGQYIESDCAPVKPAKPDVQANGATQTYLRRYSLSALLGISFKGEDDDGNLDAEERAIPKVEPESTKPTSNRLRSNRLKI